MRSGRGAAARPAASLAAALAAVACLLLVGCAGFPPGPGLRFHVYGYGSEASTTSTLAELSALPGRQQVVLHDMSKVENGDQYSDLYNFISTRLSIQILPNQIEHRIAPPVIHFSNEMRYFSQFLQPLVCAMRGRTLVAVVVGSGWYGDGFWERLSQDASGWSSLHVFTLNATTTETDAALVTEMARIIR